MICAKHGVVHTSDGVCGFCTDESLRPDRSDYPPDPVATLSAENARLRGVVDATREELSKYVSGSLQLTTENARLRADLQAATDRADQEMRENGRASMLLEAMTAENALLRASNERLRAEVEELRDSKEIADGALTGAVIEHQEFRDRIATLTADLARVTDDAAQECGRLRSDYNLLLGETQTLRELCRKQESDLARVTGERDTVVKAAWAAMDVMPHDPRAWVPGHKEAYEALRAAVEACKP